MGCRSCSGQPSVPLVRRGFPTIWAYGPFKDHEPIPYTPIEEHEESNNNQM